MFTDMTIKQTTPPTTRVRPFPESVGNASILPMGSLGCVYHPNGSRDNAMYVFSTHTHWYTHIHRVHVVGTCVCCSDSDDAWFWLVALTMVMMVLVALTMKMMVLLWWWRCVHRHDYKANDPPDDQGATVPRKCGEREHSPYGKSWVCLPSQW